LKVKFTCFDCQESFTIFTENLVRKESLACPNCEKQFPQSNLEALKKVHDILLTASEGLITTDDIGNIIQHWDYKFVY